MDDGASLARILVVEDDDGVRRALQLALTDEGYSVEGAEDATSAQERLSGYQPDLVLIDVMLPGSSGLDLCRSIRQTTTIPVIMVTARDDSHDVVAGLEAGADDYVTKPFVFKELAARVRALLRRSKSEPTTDEPDVVVFGAIRVSVGQGRVWREDQELSLTRTEFLLLSELSAHPGRVLSREHLLARVWGYDYFGDGRVVDAHIRRLRKKLEVNPAEPTYVLTVRGLGYRFEAGGGDE